MTGFARTDGQRESSQVYPATSVSWTWEIKSVNGKNLDVRLRMPHGMDVLEIKIRKAFAAQLCRGNVQANLQIKQEGATADIRINRPLLDQVLALAADISSNSRLPLAAPTIDGILNVRGVLDVAEPEVPPEELSRQQDAIMNSFLQALDRLLQARAEEGAALATMVQGHLDTIANLVAQSTARAAVQAQAIKDRFMTSIADLAAEQEPLSEERIAQEAVILAVKADVTEELNRLQAHIAHARDLLQSAETERAIGRRFDFLCQEFNREANTLCSKSADAELTRLGLDLKTEIDRLREQVQNIE
jgi:uncharacterized protein (TIGR00255 family)